VTVASTLTCSAAASASSASACARGREAEWDTDGTAGLEAQVIRDGMLVGYVPRIEGSEDFDESRIVDAIVRTDYDQPVARQRTDTPAPGPDLAREGGVFRRFLVLLVSLC
jgi:hypothetical protein